VVGYEPYNCRNTSYTVLENVTATRIVQVEETQTLYVLTFCSSTPVLPVCLQYSSLTCSLIYRVVLASFLVCLCTCCLLAVHALAVTCLSVCLCLGAVEFMLHYHKTTSQYHNITSRKTTTNDSKNNTTLNAIIIRGDC